MSEKIKTWAWAAVPVALLCLIGSVTWLVLSLPGMTQPVLSDVRAMVSQAKETTAEANKSLAFVNEYMDRNSFELQSQLESTTVLLKDTSDLVHDTRAALLGGNTGDGTTFVGVVPQLNMLLGSLNGSVVSLTVDAQKVLSTADNSLRPLNTVLENLSVLEKTIDEQIRAGSPQVFATIAEMQKAIASADRLLSDPSVTNTLKNVEKSTYHTGEVLESVDVALRSLREKLGRVKWVLNAVLSHVKAVISLH